MCVLCGLQPRHVSFEPAWALLEHELAAQIHLAMKQYFNKLREMEPDNAFRPDTLVRACSLHHPCSWGFVQVMRVLALTAVPATYTALQDINTFCMHVVTTGT